MRSVWNIDCIELNDHMRTSIDSYLRARREIEREYACFALMNQIKKYLIEIDKKEKECNENGRK